jgi:hypothetical protein
MRWFFLSDPGDPMFTLLVAGLFNVRSSRFNVEH